MLQIIERSPAIAPPTVCDRLLLASALAVVFVIIIGRLS